MKLNPGKCITLLIKSKTENNTQFGTIPTSNIKIAYFISNLQRWIRPLSKVITLEN
jgi:hypothetical protein